MNETPCNGAGGDTFTDRSAAAAGEGDGDLDAVPVGLLTVDRRLVVRQANEQGRRMLGLRQAATAVLGRRLLDGLDEDGRRHLTRALAALPHAQGVSCGEVRLSGPGQSVRVMRVEARAKSAGPEVMLAFIDVTEQRDAASRAEHAARHDALTGLPNRGHALTLLGDALARGRLHGHQVGVMFVDLDRFKNLNDTLGHEAGDRMLLEVARRLRHAAQPDGQPARLGGDEFIVLLPSLANRDDAHGRAERVAEALRQPWWFGEHEIRPSASIGVSRFPEDADDVRSLLHRADLALYRAKREGRNGVRLYCPQQDAAPRDAPHS